jgi:DNA-binding NarL/FixJ family response regulator
MNDTAMNQQTALLRVLIADGSPRSGSSLSGLMEEYGDFELAGHARTAIETLTLIEKLRPDVVLLDMEMPGETFGFLLKLIKRDLCQCKVVVMIPYASCVLRERSREAGADHVFEKTGDPERLLICLMRLAQSKRFSFRCCEQEA